MMETILESISEWGARVGPRLSASWLGIALWQYTLAFVFILISLFAPRAARYFLDRHVLRWLERSGAEYPGRIVEALFQAVRRLSGPFGDLPGRPSCVAPGGGARRRAFDHGGVRKQHLPSGYSGHRRVGDGPAGRRVGLLRPKEGAAREEPPLEMHVIPLLRRALKLFVGVMGGLLVIQHMGYPVASLLGGLGIGGLAVALAAQDTLSNFFASVILFTDRPFKVGDWVQIGDVDGDVESIGFRSTRIRTWPKTLVTIPNKIIANTQVENWSAMPKRRIRFTLPVTYDAAGQIEALVNGIEEILKRHPGVDQEYHLVNFTDFGENGLEIFVYYFSSSTVWKEHMQVRQEVNLEIMRLLERLGLKVALPSRALYVARPSGEEGRLESRQTE